MSGGTAQEVMEVPAARPGAVERVLGRVRGARPGPTLLCIGGVHGNEPAGVEGIRRALAGLEPRAAEMRGDFVALAGNRAALAVSQRFLERDLNRAWTDERIERLRREGHLNGSAEDREQVELLDAIEEVVEAARGPVYVLDLHTTSGFGGPFTTFGDTLANRDLAAHLPVPMILGLEEQVDGTLLAFLGRHGLVAVMFESGQHDEPAAVDRAEAGVWITAAAVGLLPENRVPRVAEARKLMRRATAGVPHAMEMFYRHHVVPEDGFRMDPGYRSFQPVRRGQAVASDVRGRVEVGADAHILMPLYQRLGEDGFFLIREFRPFWLNASYVLRRLRVDRFVHWLPGVSLDPDRADAVVVDRRVARWPAVQLFHLLGYRKHEDAGDRLLLRRRRYDDARYVRRGPYPEHLR